MLADLDGTLTITSAAGSETGNTVITVTEAPGAGNSYKYKVAANPTAPAVGDTCSSGYTNWNGTDEITAESGKKIVIVEVDADNKCVAVGVAVVVSKE